MIRSVVAVYIVLSDYEPELISWEENPEIGLFSIYNVIKQRDEWALCYSTDKIRGKDSDKIRAVQGFLPPDGIGTINERGDFRFGGGQVLQSGTRFKLRNTDGLKTALDEMDVKFAGRQVDG